MKKISKLSPLALIVGCAAMLLTACGGTSFSAASKKSPSQTQPTAGMTTGNVFDGSRDIGPDCLSTTQSQNFTCDNIVEARGGLIDALVGVRLMLLTQKLPLFAGENACRGRGGELIAADDFFVTKITNCIRDTDWWQDFQSTFIFRQITMASIQQKFGQTVVDSCLNRQNTNDVTAIPVGKPNDPSIPMDIYCVLPL